MIRYSEIPKDFYVSLTVSNNFFLGQSNLSQDGKPNRHYEMKKISIARMIQQECLGI